MAPEERESSDAAWAAEDTLVGSETGYSLHTTHDDGDDDSVMDETSGLLGAGTPPSGAPQEPRKDSWVGLEDFDGLPWYQRPSVWWLLGPFSIFTMAFGGIAVPKLNLILGLVCSRYYAERSVLDPHFTFTPVLVGGDNPQCLIPEVQQNVATFMLIVGVISGVLSSFTAPRLGALSDRYGRKRLMVISSFGGLVGEVITILAAKYPDAIHYNWLILGAVFDGLAGSFTAGSVLSHSYTSDCTPPSKRGVTFGYLHSCLFTGLAVGPLLAGYFVEWTGSLLSIFYVVLGCHVTFILFIFFILPESLSKRRQMLAREKYAQEQAAKQAAGGPPSVDLYLPYSRYKLDMANPFAPLKILFPKGPGLAKVRRNLLTLAFVDMSIMGAGMGAGAVVVLYTESTFGWGNLESSRFISLVSVVRVFVLTGIFPFINYWFRTRPAARARRAAGGVAAVEKNAGADELDVWVLRSALVSDVIGATGYIFVRTQELFVLCAVITAFGGLGSATLQSAMTKHVPAERVGQLLGAIGLLQSLSRIIFPVLLNGLYAMTVKTFPQAFFVMLASLFGGALLASLLVRPHVFLSDEDDAPAPMAPPERRNTLANRDLIEEEELVPGI